MGSQLGKAERPPVRRARGILIRGTLPPAARQTEANLLVRHPSQTLSLRVSWQEACSPAATTAHSPQRRFHFGQTPAALHLLESRGQRKMMTVACILSLGLAAACGGDCPAEERSQEQSHGGRPIPARRAHDGLFSGPSIGCGTPNFHAPAAYRGHRSRRGRVVRANLRAGLSREPG